MAFFSFTLLENSFAHMSTKVEPNKKYFSKDIALWKELNNRNKKKQFCIISQEIRKNINVLGKKLLFCLPPSFGLGDAFEYGIAIKSIINSNKFDQIGIAFCNKHSFIFNNIFKFSNTYSYLISEKEIKKYDTLFHITLEIEALKFQKYNRSNIAEEICKYFKTLPLNFKIKKKQVSKNYKKTISIFPVSTSIIRSLPFKIIRDIIIKFENDFEIKIIIDNSPFSKNLEKMNQKFKSLFVKPKNVEDLISEISRVDFGIFVDSGPLHIAKAYDKKGILIETTVPSKILLSNSKNISYVKNKYKSKYCNGPCGLVDLFNYNNKIGCYETNKLNFEKIKNLKTLKTLQRWDKKESNSHFISNPVGCIKEIDVKCIIDLIKVKTKEC